MAIQGLTIIGESINDSVPSTNALYEAEDFAGIQELARSQEAGGAAFIDVNVGTRSPEFMTRVSEAVVAATAVPTSIDSPDYALAEAGLRVCDPNRGKPILNSISPLRLEMFDLLKIMPFRPILLLTEHIGADGNGAPSKTAEETYSAAEFLFNEAKKRGIPNEDIIFDPGVAPLGADTEGDLGRLLETLRMIHDNPEMAGTRASKGLPSGPPSGSMRRESLAACPSLASARRQAPRGRT
ncbi:MAG: dihydropteroate synthase [Duodenibacillus sp.]|nr:dihydropteroate synthase [Duodenibacillus sp.]